MILKFSSSKVEQFLGVMIDCAVWRSLDLDVLTCKVTYKGIEKWRR